MYTVEISYLLLGRPFKATVKTPAFSAIDACKLVEMCALKMFQGVTNIETKVIS